MTVYIDASRVRCAAPSSTERLLLRTARGIEAYAISHLARRASATTTAAAQTRSTERRRDAQALGAVGILPR